MNNFHEYPIQNSLKSGGTNDHFWRVKIPGTPLIEKHIIPSSFFLNEKKL